MSRIGKKPVAVPGSVTINVNANARTIKAEGPKGKLEFHYRPEVAVEWNEGDKQVVCTIPEECAGDRIYRAHWGTVRSRVQNLVTGVAEGFTKKLKIEGVGWNAQAQGKTLRLNIGYCHPIDLVPPPGVEFAVENNQITITGPDKVAVGQFAAVIRSKRPPEPYKGKGIMYIGEHIIRKQGKVFGS